MSIEQRSVFHEAPDFILYTQHGWADRCQDMAALAKTLATPKTAIITPNLGWINTWFWIEPLIRQIEESITNAIATYPNTPIRIIGHSMGGLIWLEVLNRHPEWLSQVESLVLIASPIGGADLARIFDPLGLGIGMARDLGINRRTIASAIAKVIPTLIIAGDLDNGSDGTITIGTTKFNNAKFVCLPKLSHAILKNHPKVVKTIRDFWANPTLSQSPPDFSSELIQHLQLVPGMTDAHWRDFSGATPYLSFKNGISLLTWKNLAQVDHVFVANQQQCLYAGFVGWMHSHALQTTLQQLKKQQHTHA